MSEVTLERDIQGSSSASAACPACDAELETPLGCHACGLLLAPEEAPSPFVLFGLTPAWQVDKADLKRRLLRHSRLVHPDFHGTSTPERKALAEANSALLNGAYEVLLDDFLRADWLVRHLGGPTDSQERQMPQAFLMEVLEWNEALEEAEQAAPGTPARAALEGLARELLAKHDQELAAVGRRLTPLPAHGDAALADLRRSLNVVRYLSRALLRIRDLRFGT